ncbi:MAG: hypothetical protein LEGION0398_MBIBDBAK_00304 [Legionellaceae bacterium]
MKKKHISIIVFSLMTITLSGCFKKPIDTSKRNELEKLNVEVVTRQKTTSINTMRLTALRETAMTISAQSGLAQRANEIDAILEKRERQLSQIFNFDGMMLPQNVLPPVLIEGRDTLNLASSETIRLADRTYKIFKQARFVTTPPTWRSYLWMSYKKPPVPDVSLLPKTAEEQQIWKLYISKGWNQGKEQADAIFKENLARLKRDYTGMVLYRKLLAQNIVSAPFVAKTELGVTGGKSNIRINDQVLRITALPALQPDSKRWKPAFSKQNENSPQ